MSSSSLDRAQLLAAFDQQTQMLAATTVLFQQAVADRLKLNATDLHCGNLLKIMGPMTAGQLGELTGLTSGAITGVVDRLETAGYVRRQHDPDDRRRVVLQTNNEAMERDIVPFYDSIGQTAAHLLEHYNDQELALLLDFLTQSNAATLAETARLRTEKPANDTSGMVSATSYGEVTVPLGAVSVGHCIFAAGTTNVKMRGDPTLAQLFHGRFGQPVPDVYVQDGLVKVFYRRRSMLHWGAREAEIVLNSTIAWHIDLVSGASSSDVDLRAVRLRALNVQGNGSNIELALPQPEGTVPVRVAGNASNVVIRRPATVAVQVYLRRTSSSLKLDGQHYGAAGGKPWQTPDYASATERYDIDVVGRASSVTIETD